MAFEQFRAQLAMLMDEIAGNPHDAHELQESLREKLAEMQALGLPLPDDLVGLELPRGGPRPPRAAARRRGRGTGRESRRDGLKRGGLSRATRSAPVEPGDERRSIALPGERRRGGVVVAEARRRGNSERLSG